MKKRTINSLLLLALIPSILVSENDSLLTIRGKVLDLKTGEPLRGANVILVGTSKGAASNLTGDYTISDLLPGMYAVKCVYIGYSIQEQVLIVTDSSSHNQSFDFYLKSSWTKIPIVVPDSLQEYHSLIASLDPADIMDIRIDRISDDLKTIYLTFKNICDHPIYLIEDLECFNTASTIFYSGDGRKIRPNLLGSNCEWLHNTLPKNENIIKLNPHQSVQFPPVIINFDHYSLTTLPNRGKYYIQVKYMIKDFKYLPIVYPYDVPVSDFDNKYLDEKYVLSRATRGTYYSNKTTIYLK